MSNKTIDITKISLLNESLKLKNKKAENDLLSSVVENGINDPLLGYFDKDFFILIDGFKRYRCCQKLQINHLPIEEIALDQASAFIKTLKISNSKSLHILEQANFIKQLYHDHNMTMENIAYTLGKSRHWVSARLKLLKDITPFMKEKIFKGHFPVWNAMGILHQVKRLSLASDQDIDDFVRSTSGKHLSVKDINLLANGYFKGGEEFKKQIKNGNLSWSISNLKDFSNQSSELKDDEKRILKDLEIASKYIGRIIFKLPQMKNNNQFFSTAGILSGGILDKLDRFQLTLKTFIQEIEDDQRREGKSSMGPTQRGS